MKKSDPNRGCWRDGRTQRTGCSSERIQVQFPAQTWWFTATSPLKFKGIQHPLLTFSGTRHGCGRHLYTQAKHNRNKSIMRKKKKKRERNQHQCAWRLLCTEGTESLHSYSPALPLSVAPFLPATQAGCPKVNPQPWMLLLHHPRCQEEEQQE